MHDAATIHHRGEWSPPRFLGLCERSLSQRDAVTVEFCEKVVNDEWRLLLDYCTDRLAATQ